MSITHDLFYPWVRVGLPSRTLVVPVAMVDDEPAFRSWLQTLELADSELDELAAKIRAVAENWDASTASWLTD